MRPCERSYRGHVQVLVILKLLDFVGLVMLNVNVVPLIEHLPGGAVSAVHRSVGSPYRVSPKPVSNIVGYVYMVMSNASFVHDFCTLNRGGFPAFTVLRWLTATPMMYLVGQDVQAPWVSVDQDVQRSP